VSILFVDEMLSRLLPRFRRALMLRCQAYSAGFRAIVPRDSRTLARKHLARSSSLLTLKPQASDPSSPTRFFYCALRLASVIFQRTQAFDASLHGGLVPSLS